MHPPGKVGFRIATSAPVAPGGDSPENTASYVDDADGTLLGLFINWQGALTVGVFPGCEASPGIGPVFQDLELSVKCALLGNSPGDNWSLAVGLGGRTYTVLGPFKNYIGRTGLYASHRMDQAILMLGLHLSHGQQMYYWEHGSNYEWHTPEASVFKGRETRLTVPIGLGPIAGGRGWLPTFGIVTSVVVDSGSKWRVGEPDSNIYPAPSDLGDFKAPWEIALTFEMAWGRPLQDRPRPNVQNEESPRSLPGKSRPSRIRQ